MSRSGAHQVRKRSCLWRPLGEINRTFGSSPHPCWSGGAGGLLVAGLPRGSQDLQQALWSWGSSFWCDSHVPTCGQRAF